VIERKLVSNAVIALQGTTAVLKHIRGGGATGELSCYLEAIEKINRCKQEEQIKYPRKLKKLTMNVLIVYAHHEPKSLIMAQQDIAVLIEVGHQVKVSDVCHEFQSHCRPG